MTSLHSNPLVIQHSYGQWQFPDDLPIKDGNFQKLYMLNYHNISSEVGRLQCLCALQVPAGGRGLMVSTCHNNVKKKPWS